MPGLKIYFSNRLEILAAELAQVIRQPLEDPLTPETIVVQSRGMQRWLFMQIAQHKGVAANLQFPFPNAFLAHLSRQLLADDPTGESYQCGPLTFRVMQVLPECLPEPDFFHLRTYLADDAHMLKRFQLARRIADCFDQYLLFRPEMMLAWEQGRDRHWQAQLWRRLVDQSNDMHRVRIKQRLVAALRHSAGASVQLPPRVCLFGVSYLPRFHLEVLAELSRVREVCFFLMNPCREYWSEITSAHESHTLTRRYAGLTADQLHLELGNRLLASWGLLGRDFFSLIHQFDCEQYDRFEDIAPKGALHSIQADILNLSERAAGSSASALPSINAADANPAASTDRSIQVHACHSPMREVEVLHDQLLAMFEADPGLRPNDVLVITPDIDTYAPLIGAVFGASSDATLRIPYRIADRSLRRQSRMVEAFICLLRLPSGRMGAAEVLALLNVPAISARFNLDQQDLELVAHWVWDSGIRWGKDAASRQQLGLPAYAENTWETGIQRLLLGYAMRGHDTQMFRGILPYDQIEGTASQALGALIDFLELIFGAVQRLGQPRALSGWRDELARLLEDFFRPDESQLRDMQLLRDLLSDLAAMEALADYHEPVGIEIVSSWLTEQLDRDPSGAGFLAGGVTFAAMLPMRSVPFQVVCLVGMNNAVFPRQDRPLGFDLMAQKPRPGDRSRRLDDKYLFLETLLSARQILYLSYVGQSIQDNSPIPPSVLVNELLDYLKAGFGLPGTDSIMQRHRLQAFSTAYFNGRAPLFSYSQENFAAAQALTKGPSAKGSDPLVANRLSAALDEWLQLDLSQLTGFFNHPTRFLLKQRLGIDLPEDTVAVPELEPFRLEGLERYQMGQELVAQRRQGQDLSALLAAYRAAGQLPPGSMGEVDFERLSGEAGSLVRNLERFVDETALAPLDIQLKIGAFTLSGRLQERWRRGILRLRFVKTNGCDLLAAWIEHLALSASIGSVATSLLILRDGAWCFGPVTQSAHHLAGLLDQYADGLRRPLPFFARASYAYAQALHLQGRAHQAALAAARKVWQGSVKFSGEQEDPYHRLCYQDELPLGQTFEEVAQAVFDPLFAHLEQV